jgi:hypothetical protein
MTVTIYFNFVDSISGSRTIVVFSFIFNNDFIEAFTRRGDPCGRPELVMVRGNRKGLPLQ